MAHELTFTNGQATMFSVLETPWHREGKILTEAPSFKDALTLGGLIYPLEKKPYLMPAPNAQPGYVEAGDAFYVWRPDTNQSLGSVGGSYEIVTNEDAFKPLEPLVDGGVLKLETGGVLREGADAWLLGRWDLTKFGPEAQKVFGQDIIPFATICANHNGRRGVLLG